MEYIKASSFRQLQASPFTVVTVYPKYRNGGIMSGDKFIGRTFVYDDGNLKEKKWDSDNKTFVFSDITDIKINAEFFKVYKKVFDVVVKLDKKVTIKEKRGDMVTEVSGDEFVVKALGTGKLQKMLDADFDIVVPEDENGKRPFDWEDDLVKKLEGSKFKMKVTGQGLDTSYTFQLISRAEQKELEKTPEEKLDEPW